MKGHVFASIGVVTADRKFRVRGVGGEMRIEEGIDDLRKAWQEPLAF